MANKSKVARSAKSKKKTKVVPEGTQEIHIPDAAITYIVSRYLRDKGVEGVPVVTGIPSDAVEDVLRLFLEWATANGYVRDNMLVIGGLPVD